MNLLELIKAAIKEDMPTGDLTTESLGQRPKTGTARLKAKQDLVLSGTLAFEQSMHALEPNAKVKWNFEEGQHILNGQTICSIDGDLIQVLKAERVALNFLGQLSGIATTTKTFVDQVKHTQTKILDTRKTTPVFRELEKRAVLHGGGVNHRFNLSDAVMIKDNHIALMGGITKAVQQVRKHTNKAIECEASTLDEVKECIENKVERILLDNMDNELLKQALAIIPKSIQTEASGNMSVGRVRSVAELGVDFISVGALTHSAPCADVSLKFEW